MVRGPAGCPLAATAAAISINRSRFMDGWLQDTSAAPAPRYTVFGMKKLFLIPILAAALLLPALAQTSANPFLGRWDLTVTGPRNNFPDWLEVTEKDGALAARYQPSGGASQPIRALKMDGARLILTISPATKARPETVWELTANGDKI